MFSTEARGQLGESEGEDSLWDAVPGAASATSPTAQLVVRTLLTERGDADGRLSMVLRVAGGKVFPALIVIHDDAKAGCRSAHGVWPSVAVIALYKDGHMCGRQPVRDDARESDEEVGWGGGRAGGAVWRCHASVKEVERGSAPLWDEWLLPHPLTPLTARVPTGYALPVRGVGACGWALCLSG